ncbi:hypothetical protein AV530_014572 [Patagioenas fasciata monilis]|uniref:Uncharacterized protein n=1 Tax=Patagioenas fasciata monilis TaxID=372326 RepID=A0A1V4KCG0_PATFA|nr:hypothetical protein AV530_014572 [Patagioenas fasciata monilis]
MRDAGRGRPRCWWRSARQLLQQAQPSWLHVPTVLIPVPWKGSHGASLREAVREGGGAAWLGAQEFLLSQLKLPDGYPGDNRSEIIYVGKRGDYLTAKQEVIYRVPDPSHNKSFYRTPVSVTSMHSEILSTTIPSFC